MFNPKLFKHRTFVKIFIFPQIIRIGGSNKNWSLDCAEVKGH